LSVPESLGKRAWYLVSQCPCSLLSPHTCELPACLLYPIYLQDPATQTIYLHSGNLPVLYLTSSISTSSFYCVVVHGQQYIRPKPLPSNYAWL
jgi:hypothetical protein